MRLLKGLLSESLIVFISYILFANAFIIIIYLLELLFGGPVHILLIIFAFILLLIII